MTKKLIGWKTKGMSRDLSVSAFNPEFAFENMNLRLSTNESNTLLSLVNEKGTLDLITSQELEGTPIGTAVINHQLIIFTTEEYEETIQGTQGIGKIKGVVTSSGIKTTKDIIASNTVKTISATAATERHKAKADAAGAPSTTMAAIKGYTSPAALPWLIASGSNEAGSRPPSPFFDDIDEEEGDPPATYTNTVHIDRIYKAVFNNSEKLGMSIEILFEGNLNLSPNYPLETLVSYESESIQKVYWTDGVNQPRLINIASKLKFNDNTQFDFVPTLKLQETVKVAKMIGVGGQFAAGVIQYAFTYYRKNGQETAIFYTTPLYYISPKDRGGAPDEKVDNAFKINIDGLDSNFDYLRIYSIQRTSINATPLAKRVQDIYIKDIIDGGKTSTTYIDNGVSGDTIDPMELLYKGGETITCGTMKDKDGTLFLGNISLKRSSLNALKSTIQNPSNFTLKPGLREFCVQEEQNENYKYANQLTAYDSSNKDNSVPCAGFKYGEVYRCGVQFQHTSGKWSDPIFLKDIPISSEEGAERPHESVTINGIPDPSHIRIPIINGSIAESVATNLKDNWDYVKVRPVVVYPEYQDRNIICQGVVDKTLHNKHVTATVNNAADTNVEKYQSSWFFRPSLKSINSNLTPAINASDGVTVSPHSYEGRGLVPVVLDHGEVAAPQLEYFRRAEIQGGFDDSSEETDVMLISYDMLTMHTPEAEFDSLLAVNTFDSVNARTIGEAVFKKTFSDINIQTETPPISSRGGGFVHKSFVKDNSYGIVSGLFYDDFMVDDNMRNGESVFEWLCYEKAAVKWLVYPWQMSGSLNNDINRPANKGVASSILKKKVISNLRYATTDWSAGNSAQLNVRAQLFSSDGVSILKDGNNIYQGNVDTAIIPHRAEGVYLCADSITVSSGHVSYTNTVTEFDSTNWFKLGFEYDNSNQTEVTKKGLRKWSNGTPPSWEGFGAYGSDVIADDYEDLAMKRSQIRMKYRSAPHLLISGESLASSFNDDATTNNFALKVVELSKNVVESTRFGGTSNDALRENNWIPCGEPVSLNNVVNGKVSFQYSWGDTYYQRYDCMKTYPFTNDDINQIVEIGSFMLETRCNIDGRYDRNRGMQDNTNMSPINFNLYNPVYSQLNNFFTYKIKDDSYYTDTEFPNQITWTLTKQSGADVDAWTHITLASILEMDGSKGSVNSLQRLNDQLICFQNSSVSQILYNENTQISTTEGVPIEIANSGKVQGKRDISGSIGCSNKWSIANTPSGIYFIDGNEKNIYLFNGKLSNLSVAGGLNTWCKQNIPPSEIIWNPSYFSNFVSYYDKGNLEILFINNTIALAYSEKLNTFTGFFAYGGTPYFANVDDAGVWLKNKKIWKHQGGKYCDFFGTMRPYWMILIGNPEPQLDKIFTNLEFRACVDNDGEFIDNTGRFLPTLPFDFLEVWNEYQHGVAFLENKNGHDAMVHHKKDKTASLKRRFRIWRCDIPRDNVGTRRSTDVIDPFSVEFDDTFHPDYSTIARPLDRMRNPWLYIKLMKKSSEVMEKVEIHDLLMTYRG